MSDKDYFSVESRNNESIHSVEAWFDPDVKELAASLFGDELLFSQAEADDRMHFYGLASKAMSWFVSKYADRQDEV